LKDTTPPLPGGAAVTSDAATTQENRPESGKFSKQKSGDSVGVGAPEIADPNADPALYVEQCGFVITWVNEMFRRVESGDERLAGEARYALGWLLERGCRELEKLALPDRESEVKAWAGRTLAYIGALMESDREKLCKANKAYRQERTELGKLLRNDLWFPRNPLYQALHRELCLCEVYRGETPWAKAQRYLPEIQPNVVPAEYDSIMKLPPLSPKSLPDWEPELWLLVMRHNPGLLEELRRNSSRQEIVWTYSDGSSKQQVKSRKLFWKDFRPQFRNHLKAVADCQE
jgi:hypothetical protein